jgi:hypothetical protein
VSPSAEQVAASWRVASPAAVHPELDGDGQPWSTGSAEETINELLAGIELYLPTFPSNLSLLDYAGGPGRLARIAIDLFDFVLVADTNPAYLEIAGADGLNTLLVSPIPKALPTTDVILCVNLFLHLPPATGAELLWLFARTLPRHGLLALQLPLYDVAVPPATWTSVGTWTLPQLEAAAADAGLVVLEAHTNPGRYLTGKQPGPNHARLHFLKPLTF